MPRVETLLARPDAVETLFSTDHRGRTALDWAVLKGSTGAAVSLKTAMSLEMRERSSLRDTKERKKVLRGLAERNAQLRAILEHCINEQ